MIFQEVIDHEGHFKLALILFCEFKFLLVIITVTFFTASLKCYNAQWMKL